MKEQHQQLGKKCRGYSLLQLEVKELLTLGKVYSTVTFCIPCATGIDSFVFFLFHSISRTNVTSGNKIGDEYVERKAYCLLFHTIDHFTSISLFLLSRFSAPVPILLVLSSRSIASLYSLVFHVCASSSFKRSCTQADIRSHSLAQGYSVSQI